MPSIVTPVTVSVAVKVSVMTSPALASVVVLLFDNSETAVTVGATVSTVTVAVGLSVVELPAVSVAVIATAARPLVSPACTV